MAISRPSSQRIDRPGLAWALFECGRIPYVTMLAVVFMPYFATVVIPDAVAGQAEVASFAKIAGFIAACTAPLLGATIDRFGPRKPWIASFVTVLVLIVASLWFVQPDAAGLPIPVVVAMLVLAKLFYTYTEMMHNSLLGRAADASEPARISGLSILLGSLSGFTFLLMVLIVLTLPETPPFGLDPTSYQHIRIVPVLSAVVMTAASLPLLLAARDFPPQGRSLFAAFAAGTRHLGGLLGHLRQRPDAAWFLLARMIYADGIAAITLLTGVLAGGVMGWKASELLILGIGQLAAAGIGAAALARLDLRIGSRRTLQIMLSGMLLMLLGVVGTSPTQIAFVPWSGGASPFLGLPLFRTVPDLVFLGLLLVLTGLSGGTTSSSRALLAALTPPGESGAWFGLYAMAGTATAWLAPLAIEATTRATGSQQTGFGPVLVFLLIGLALLSRVNEPSKGKLKP